MKIQIDINNPEHVKHYHNSTWQVTLKTYIGNHTTIQEKMGRKQRPEKSIGDGRKCTKCFARKKWEAFSISHAGFNGHVTVCKPCTAIFYPNKKKPSIKAPKMPKVNGLETGNWDYVQVEYGNLKPANSDLFGKILY